MIRERLQAPDTPPVRLLTRPASWARLSISSALLLMLMRTIATITPRALRGEALYCRSLYRTNGWKVHEPYWSNMVLQSSTVRLLAPQEHWALPPEPEGQTMSLFR